MKLPYIYHRVSLVRVSIKAHASPLTVRSGWKSPVFGLHTRNEV
jgi:hypothetical protein